MLDVNIVEKLHTSNKMIPSINALKTALRYLLVDRVDTQHAKAMYKIIKPDETQLHKDLENASHDLSQVCEFLSNQIKEREEMN